MGVIIYDGGAPESRRNLFFAAKAASRQQTREQGKGQEKLQPDVYRPSTMSTHATVVATSPENGGDNGSPPRNSYARVVGSACAGVSELLLFHPVDTVAKRLMSNQTVAVKGQPTAEAMAALNKVRARETGSKCCVVYVLSRFVCTKSTPRRHVFGWRRPHRRLQ